MTLCNKILDCSDRGVAQTYSLYSWCIIIIMVKFIIIIVKPLI